MYKSQFIAAGLTPKQAAVYEACLDAGPSRIPEIAQSAGVKRTTAYGIVEELLGLGLLTSSYKGKRKVYAAQDPSALVSMLEEKKKRVADIMPQLSELFITRHARPKITFVEGREGVKKIYDDILECTSKEV